MVHIDVYDVLHMVEPVVWTNLQCAKMMLADNSEALKSRVTMFSWMTACVMLHRVEDVYVGQQARLLVMVAISSICSTPVSTLKIFCRLCYTAARSCEYGRGLEDDLVPVLRPLTYDHINDTLNTPGLHQDRGQVRSAQAYGM